MRQEAVFFTFDWEKSIDFDKCSNFEENFCFQANVLGKGVTHIAGDMSHAGGEPSVYSVSNLIRKLRLEDAGTAIKPTPARAQVPAEYQDGVLTFCVQPLNLGQVAIGGRPSTATKPSQHQQANIVVASKTK